MPIKPDLVNIDMAQQVCEYVLKRGGWPECTPEAILLRASTYEELHRWVGVATGDRGTPFPQEPEANQVIYIEQGGTSYRYVHHNGAWRFVDAMPAYLRNAH